MERHPKNSFLKKMTLYLSGMTHLTCSSLSLLFHMAPPSLTTQGMLASMMTSLGTWRFVIPDKIVVNLSKGMHILTFARVHHSEARSGLITLKDSGLYLRLLRVSLNLVINISEAVIWIHSEADEEVIILGEHVLVKHPHHVAEHDRVRHLHHRGLEIFNLK